MGRARDLANILSSSSSVALDSEMGLVFINASSFTSVANVSLAQDTFTTTYDNYLIVMNLASSAGNINIRMRTSGTDASGSDYNNQRFGASEASSSFARTNTTFWNAAAQVGSRSTINLWVYGPKLAQPTIMLSENSRNVSGPDVYIYGGGHNVSTAYDSLTIIDASSNMTGKYYVYGLRN